MKIHPLEAEFFHANRQTARQKNMNLVTSFQNFEKEPQSLKFYDLSEMYVCTITLYNTRFQIFAVGYFTRCSILSADAV
jgi:hypothetical protein